LLSLGFADSAYVVVKAIRDRLLLGVYLDEGEPNLSLSLELINSLGVFSTTKTFSKSDSIMIAASELCVLFDNDRVCVAGYDHSLRDIIVSFTVSFLFCNVVVYAVSLLILRCSKKHVRISDFHATFKPNAQHHKKWTGSPTLSA